MIETLLKSLEQKIIEFPEMCFFNKGIATAKIVALEKKLGFRFPTSFTVFLSRYNGGFISLLEAGSCKMDLESSAWNSNEILGLEEIEEAYNRMAYKFEDEAEVFVPFLHTENQEYLGFSWKKGQERMYSKVYDLWHEAFPNEWKEQDVYDSFEELLDGYISDNGIIITIG
jgi:SMI1 / KNR4 family (SUKH-1)